MKSTDSKMASLQIYSYRNVKRILAGETPREYKLFAHLASLGLLLITVGLFFLHSPYAYHILKIDFFSNLSGGMLVTVLLPLIFFSWYIFCDKPDYLRSGRIGHGRFSLPLWVLLILPAVVGLIGWFCMDGPYMLTHYAGIMQRMFEGETEGYYAFIESFVSSYNLFCCILATLILSLVHSAVSRGLSAFHSIIFLLVGIRESAYLAVKHLDETKHFGDAFICTQYVWVLLLLAIVLCMIAHRIGVRLRLKDHFNMIHC